MASLIAVAFQFGYSERKKKFPKSFNENQG
jgi:hypothetical protein